MRTKTGEATLVFRVQQGDAHHRIFTAQRRIFHQDAIARRAQTLDACRDAWVTRDDFFWHIGQTDAVTDDAVLDIAFIDLGECLRARLLQRIASGHAVAHVQIADEIDGE